MHPNNKQINGYNFQEMLDAYPALEPYLYKNKYDRLSLDFSNREAIILFNKILLATHYGIKDWDVPNGHLCPTIPGRADYLHYLQDILGNGPKRLLDIGTGASVVYPLLGSRLFDWSFVASDIDNESLLFAQQLLDQNRISTQTIELRLQNQPEHIFKHIVLKNEVFDASICNPPFFESAAQQLLWHNKKWAGKETMPIGTSNELICDGGEQAFIVNMIKESVAYQAQVKLFTCLVSRQSTIPFIEEACASLGITDLRFVEMKTGRKLSRIAVWSF